jgi:hypothetical protein
VVRDAIPAAGPPPGGHPAKRTFQAIRIEVNRELEICQVPSTPAIAATRRVAGWRARDHSGEDRIAKERFRRRDRRLHVPAGLPCVCDAVQTVRLLRPGVEATAARVEPTPGPSRPGCAPPRSSPSASSASRSTTTTGWRRRPAAARQLPCASPCRARRVGQAPRLTRSAAPICASSPPPRGAPGCSPSVCLVVFGIMFGLVAFQAKIAADQLRLDRVETGASDAQATYERLRLAVAQLESPRP